MVAASNPSGSQCQSTGFCDPDLEGLPYGPAIDLVGVPPGEQCLIRSSYAKGIWQHDPSRAAGMDFVGPLDEISYVPGDQATYGHLPLLSPEIWDECGIATPVNVLKHQTVNAVADGDLGLLRRQVCEDGTALIRHDRLEPDAFPTACPDAFNLLGYTEQDQVCGGASSTLRTWRRVGAIKFPETQIDHYPEIDLEALAATTRLAVWKKSGNCWVLSSADLAEASNECDSLGATGDEFDKLIACDGGIKKAVEADNDQMLISCNSHWKKIARGLTYYPLASPVEMLTPSGLIGSGGYTIALTLPDFPASPCEHEDSKVYAQFSIFGRTVAHGLYSPYIWITAPDSQIAFAVGGSYATYGNSQPMVHAETANLNLTLNWGAGHVGTWLIYNIQLLGYWK